jgi:hypothetical protein
MLQQRISLTGVSDGVLMPEGRYFTDSFPITVTARLPRSYAMGFWLILRANIYDQGANCETY